MKAPFGSSALSYHHPYAVYAGTYNRQFKFYSSHSAKRNAIKNANQCIRRGMYNRLAIMDIRSGVIIWYKEGA